MNKPISYSLVLALGFISHSVFAQSNQFNITANTTSGCNVLASDINFGQLIASVNQNTTLNVHCSKGANVTIEGTGSKNPDALNGHFMTIGTYTMTQGTSNKDYTKGLGYILTTNNISSNSDFTLVYRPRDNFFAYDLAKIGFAAYNHSMIVKSLTGNNIPLVFTATVLNTNPFKQLAPGDYYDNFTYTLTY